MLIFQLQPLAVGFVVQPEYSLQMLKKVFKYHCNGQCRLISVLILANAVLSFILTLNQKHNTGGLNELSSLDVSLPNHEKHNASQTGQETNIYYKLVVLQIYKREHQFFFSTQTKNTQFEHSLLQAHGEKLKIKWSHVLWHLQLSPP